MLLAKGKMLSAVAGLAMLAIPVSAFAGHRPDKFRAVPPAAVFSQGFHHGWAAHTHALAYRQAAGRGLMPVWRPQPNGWNNGWQGDDDDQGWRQRPQNWQRPGQAPNYGCDADGDNCRSNGYAPQYQSSYDDDSSNYGGQPYSWYMSPAPSGYNQPQQLNWLIARRQAAMALTAQMRARGDSRGADRVVKRLVNPLNARINRLQRQGYAYNTTNYNYGPSSYAAPVAPVNPMMGALAGNPAYYGTGANSPTLNAITAVAPLLGIR